MSGSVKLSFEVESDLKDWIDEEAERQDRPASEVVAEVLGAAMRRQAARDEMIRAAIREADKGVFISSEKVTEWFLSLGTENELPEPEPDVFIHRS